jgi:glutamate N-acetyltransferase/amino-acid N-acetyltransferase
MSLVEPSPGAVESCPGHVATALGFRACGVHAGIRRSRPDLALIVSDRPATAAGVFTRNKVQAAPVLYTRAAIADGRARAIVVNAGNANACTGPRGERDTLTMAVRTAEALGLEASEVLVASTGVIGVPLPIDRVEEGIERAASALPAAEDGAARDQGGHAAAAAIMTTDTVPKLHAVRVTLPSGGSFVVGGIAKGSGMIAPDMATTLAFVTTDAAVPAAVLDRELRRAPDETFNSITVDGDTSTNDCVLVLANGASGESIDDEESLELFRSALRTVLLELALAVVRDGEGATRLVRIEVEGARSDDEARRAGLTVANSLLVKTAIHGGEPNWGRILPAVGRSGVEMEPERTRLWAGDVQLVEGGLGLLEDFSQLGDLFTGDEVSLRIDLGLGDGRATVYTCDLSAEYVRINGSYIS